MGRTVQIRNVPEKTHEVLKARAAEAGVSLSEYLSGELDKMAEESANEDVWEQVRNLEPLNLPMSAADMIREAREERDRELEKFVPGRR
jgi:plasmid stability protein